MINAAEPHGKGRGGEVLEGQLQPLLVQAGRRVHIVLQGGGGEEEGIIGDYEEFPPLSIGNGNAPKCFPNCANLLSQIAIKKCLLLRQLLNSFAATIFTTGIILKKWIAKVKVPYYYIGTGTYIPGFDF